MAQFSRSCPVRLLLGTSCELGTIAASEGSTECQDCGLGEYANATGMSSCYRWLASFHSERMSLRCGAGTGQENLWTTSREVTSDGKVVVLQLLGSASQSFCACDAGSFLWEGRCQAWRLGVGKAAARCAWKAPTALEPTALSCHLEEAPSGW